MSENKEIHNDHEGDRKREPSTTDMTQRDKKNKKLQAFWDESDDEIYQEKRSPEIEKPFDYNWDESPNTTPKKPQHRMTPRTQTKPPPSFPIYSQIKPPSELISDTSGSKSLNSSSKNSIKSLKKPTYEQSPNSEQPKPAKDKYVKDKEHVEIELQPKEEQKPYKGGGEMESSSDIETDFEDESIPWEGDPPNIDSKSIVWMRATGGSCVYHFSRWFRVNVVFRAWFENFIIIVILVNCIFMMFENPNDPDQFQLMEYIFAVIFLIEMLCKWFGFGLWGTYKKKWFPESTVNDKDYYGYFYDRWNTLDFVIVLSSISIFLNKANVSSIRVLRVLRPLRTLKKIPNLQRLIESIMGSAGGLVDVLVLLLFLFVCFAVVGVELFQGVLHRRCFDITVPLDATLEDYDRLNYSEHTDGTYCRDVVDSGCTSNCKARQCPSDYPHCLEIADNPEDYGGVVTWDNFIMAMIQIFWIISLEAWVNQMYLVQDTFSPYVWVYYYFLTILVSFFTVNLCLAVIQQAYVGDHEEEEINMDAKINKNLFRSVFDNIDDANMGGSEIEPDLCQKEPRKEKLKSPHDVKTDRKNIEMDEKENEEDNGDHNSDQFIFPSNPDGSLDPTREHLRLYEERKDDFLVAFWAWNKSEKEENLYLKGKSDLVIEEHSWIVDVSNALQHKCYEISTSEWFGNLIIVIIFANTITLSLYWPNIDNDLVVGLEACNVVFTWIFFAEMVVKCIGFGIKGYWEDPWNKFDAIIVWISVIEFLVTVIAAQSGDTALSSLRSFRLLRGLRIMRVVGKFQSLRILLNGVLQSVADVAYLIVVLGLFFFMFSVLGQSLFGKHWKHVEDSEGQWTFGKNFWWSFLVVFQIITGDAWNSIMVDAVKVTDKWATLYFIITLSFGAFVILNLFIAILLSSFEGEGEEKWLREDTLTQAVALREKDMETLDGLRVLVDNLRMRRHKKLLQKKMATWKKSVDKKEMLSKSFGFFRKTNPIRIKCNHLVHNSYFSITIDILIIINCVFLALESPDLKDKPIFKITEIIFTIIFIFEMLVKMIALGVFPQPWFSDVDWWVADLTTEERKRWQRRCAEAAVYMKEMDQDRLLFHIQDNVVHKVITSDETPSFDIVQFTKTEDMRMIFENGIFRSAYILSKNECGVYDWAPWEIDPPSGRSDINTICKSYQLDFTNYNSYLSTRWDRLDCFVVICAIFGLLFEDTVAIFRALRAARPLRIVARTPQVKVVVIALIRSLPSMLNTLVFCFLFWFILAIVGVKSFSEGMWSCVCLDEDDADCAARLELVERKENCVGEGMAWENAQWNFDNVFSATHALFTVATLSGWNETLYTCVNSRGKERQPVEFNRPFVGVFFVIVILVCAFFSLNLIVSVIIDTFNRLKMEKSGSAFLTEKQQLWVKGQRLSNRIFLTPQYDVPTDGTCRRKIYDIVQKEEFDLFIIGCILVNTCFMAAEHYNMEDGVATFLSVVDIIFLIIYTSEAIAKITAYGFKDYIYDGWNKFDFFIVMIGYISMINIIGVGLTVMRLARIGRALRLINKTKTLQTLFLTLLYSVPSLWNIGVLIFVIFFIFGVIGMNLFGDKGCRFLADGETLEEEAAQCEDDMDKANFANFSNSLGLLYRVATEDGWTDLYSEYQLLMDDESYLVYIYFTLFFLMGVLIMVNLFIAVILDVFEDNIKDSEQEIYVVSVHSWRDEWQKYDQRASKKITADQFLDTIINADAPAGFGGKPPPEREMALKLFKLQLITDKIHPPESQTYSQYFFTFLEECPCFLEHEDPIQKMLTQHMDFTLQTQGHLAPSTLVKVKNKGGLGEARVKKYSKASKMYTVVFDDQHEEKFLFEELEVISHSIRRRKTERNLFASNSRINKQPKWWKELEYPKKAEIQRLVQNKENNIELVKEIEAKIKKMALIEEEEQKQLRILMEEEGEGEGGADLQETLFSVSDEIESTNNHNKKPSLRSIRSSSNIGSSNNFGSTLSNMGLASSPNVYHSKNNSISSFNSFLSSSSYHNNNNNNINQNQKKKKKELKDVTEKDIHKFLDWWFQQKEMQDQQLELDKGKMWMVDYPQSVAALVLQVLTDAGQIKVPLIIEKNPGEKTICEYYCNDKLNRPELYQNIVDMVKYQDIKEQRETVKRNPTYTKTQKEQLIRQVSKTIPKISNEIIESYQNDPLLGEKIGN